MAEIKTLSDLLSYSSKFDITPLAFFETDSYGNVTVQTTQIDRYRKSIEKHVKSYQVDPSLKSQFQNRPDLLSAKIYKTPTLAWFIMALNGAESPSRFFVKNKIKLIEPSILENIFIDLKSKDIRRLEKNHKDNKIL